MINYQEILDKSVIDCYSSKNKSLRLSTHFKIKASQLNTIKNILTGNNVKFAGYTFKYYKEYNNNTTLYIHIIGFNNIITGCSCHESININNTYSINIDMYSKKQLIECFTNIISIMTKYTYNFNILKLAYISL